jgi:hypothetical protein
LIEPDVALTDFGLAAECALFAGWLHWQALGDSPLRRWLVVLFAALGAGALLGGITHGFLADQQSDGYRIAWAATLISIGVTALASWAIGAHMLFGDEDSRRWVLIAAGWLLGLNVATVLWVSQSFAVAVVFYVPAVAFVLAAFVLTYARLRQPYLLAGVAGLVLSLAAAAIQQAKVGFPPLGLSHNALYHLVQAVGLLLIFVAGRRLAGETPAAAMARA